MRPSAVICKLCLESKWMSELSTTSDGHYTDVCLTCFQRETRAIVAQLEAIMGLTLVVKPKTSDNEITQEVTLKVCECGYVIDCWCKRCHICEDVTVDE